MSPEAVPAYDVDVLVGSAAREAGSLLQVLQGSDRQPRPALSSRTTANHSLSC
jgi:hypothetical protein